MTSLISRNALASGFCSLFVTLTIASRAEPGASVRFGFVVCDVDDGGTL